MNIVSYEYSWDEHQSMCIVGGSKTPPKFPGSA